MKQNYRQTLRAGYIGYVVQAIVNNFIPLLFLTFQDQFQITLERITLLVTINFAIQLTVDFFSARFVDRIGYRGCIVAAHILAAAGLAGLSFLPDRVPGHYGGILVCVAMYAVGGGIIEVLVSPIVEACPTENKKAAMSLLHSFYCWGCVIVVLFSTLFFSVAGIGNWRLLALLWAVVPGINAWYFSKVPIIQLVEEGEGLSFSGLFREGAFWGFVLVFICAGAAEQAMSQWASSFAESGLQVSKTAGDLAGPCMFAVLMGTARLLYARFSHRLHLVSCMMASTALCIVSYLLAVLAQDPVLSLAGCALCGLSVGILWPGAFSLASARIPKGGTAMFAFLALAGDLGCSAGPTLVGVVSGRSGGDLKAGLAAAVVIPVLLLLLLTQVLAKEKREHRTGDAYVKGQAL